MSHRTIHTIALEPGLGSTFQPTGFPNLGAAMFSRPTDDGGWQDCLLVESAQSMANRLEATLWPIGAEQPDEVVAGLPYVEVLDEDGNFKTSSRIESHRLASPYVRLATKAGSDDKFWTEINQRLGLESDRQRAPREFADALFDLDPLCLIHGLFLSDKVFPGQPKVARAVTSVIEAHDVRQAHSGGVKKDHVQPSAGSGGGTKEGYGMVPFDRTEWVARHIQAKVIIDHDQIRSYGLSPERTEALEALVHYEVASLFDGHLRLRTACDLEVVGATSTPEDAQPLSVDKARERLRAAIAEVGSADPIVVTHAK